MACQHCCTHANLQIKQGNPECKDCGKTWKENIFDKLNWPQQKVVPLPYPVPTPYPYWTRPFYGNGSGDYKVTC